MALSAMFADCVPRVGQLDGFDSHSTVVGSPVVGFIALAKAKGLGVALRDRGFMPASPSGAPALIYPPLFWGKMDSAAGCF